MATVLSLQLARVFFPLVFELGERTGKTIDAVEAGLLGLAVFLVPLLAPLFRRWLGPRATVVAAAVGLATARLPTRGGRPRAAISGGSGRVLRPSEG